MSLPYLPGWWDQINRDGAAEKAFSAFDKSRRPDAYANQSLQQMMQQNPGMLDKIANMDPQQRTLFSQTMGFQNQNPFENLAPGQQLLDRQEKASAVAKLNPQQKEQRSAVLAGVDSERKMGREDKLFDTSLEGMIIDNKTGKQNLEKLETEFARNENILIKAAPDIHAAAKAYVAGQQVPQELLERIFADKNLGPAFSGYVEAFQLRMRLNSSAAIASMRTPQEKMIGLQQLNTLIDNTRQELTPLISQTSENNAILGMMDMSGTGNFRTMVARRQKLEAQLDQMQRAYMQEMQKLGMQIPDMTSQTPPLPADYLKRRPSLGELGGTFGGRP